MTTTTMHSFDPRTNRMMCGIIEYRMAFLVTVITMGLRE